MLLNKNLYFVRHAQSTGNAMTHDERVACQIPNHAFPLTDIGRRQAEITGRYLKEVTKGSQLSFLHSTFQRTVETARIIMGIMEVKNPPICDERLDEKWDGIFHDLSKSELQSRYADQIRLREKTGYYHYRAPGGENGPDVERRVREIISDYFSVHDSGGVVIIGHGRWFLFFQRVFHGLSVEQFLKLREQETCHNCSVTMYRSLTHYTDLPITICPWKGKVEESQVEFA